MFYEKLEGHKALGSTSRLNMFLPRARVTETQKEISGALVKAKEAYAALDADQSSDYQVVKGVVVAAYEVVPEAYRQ